jgi:hypothetical protein
MLNRIQLPVRVQITDLQGKASFAYRAPEHCTDTEAFPPVPFIV